MIGSIPLGVFAAVLPRRAGVGAEPEAREDAQERAELESSAAAR